MRRLIALSAVAACSFSGNPAGDDGDDTPVAPDAPASIDGGSADAALPDAMPSVDAAPDGDLDDDGVLDDTDNCVLIGNPLQHDHDSDGRGDECDLCPHIMTAMDADGDGDGVGDPCDPRVGPDVRTLWFGFYDAGELAGWTGDTAQFSVSGGALRRAGPGNVGTLAAPGVVHNAYAATSATVTEVAGGTSVRFIGVSVGVVGSTQRYACRARYQQFGGTNAEYEAVWTGGQVNDSDSLGMSIGNGTTLGFTVWVSATGGRCDVDTPSQIPLGGAAVGPTDGRVTLYADDFSASFDYLFVVSIGD
jgi:hypothetical protein